MNDARVVNPYPKGPKSLDIIIYKVKGVKESNGQPERELQQSKLSYLLIICHFKTTYELDIN